MWLERSTIRDPAGRPKLYRRYLLGTGRSFGVFLHHFVASDDPNELHDHPWTWAVSLVLLGGYFEERRRRDDRGRERRWLGPLRLNVLRPGVFHRVELRDGVPSWSLFVHGRKVRRWGFLDDATGAFRFWSPAPPRDRTVDAAGR